MQDSTRARRHLVYGDQWGFGKLEPGRSDFKMDRFAEVFATKSEPAAKRLSRASLQELPGILGARGGYLEYGVLADTSYLQPWSRE